MLKVAKRAAIQAGKLLIKLRGEKLSAQIKGDSSSIVTKADLESEKLIFQILKSSFPQHNFVSEEKGSENNNSEFTWVIDPLDGTGPYFSGMPNFGVSIGLLKGKIPIVGVINLPAIGMLAWAEKGKGAYLNGKKIKVSRQNELSKAMVGFDLAWQRQREEEIGKLLRPVAPKVRYTPILGCTVNGLVNLACGIYDAYTHWAYQWDYVAGAAIVKEAGGKLTDYQGREINWSKETMSVLASNGLLHIKLVNLIK